MIKHYNITIFGQVQGVGFRWSAHKQAKKLEITGFAKNQQDGTVYIEAEGEDAQLVSFLAWCHKGPMFARVERADKTEGDLKNFKEFEVFE